MVTASGKYEDHRYPAKSAVESSEDAKRREDSVTIPSLRQCKGKGGSIVELPLPFLVAHSLQGGNAHNQKSGLRLVKFDRFGQLIPLLGSEAL